MSKDGVAVTVVGYANHECIFLRDAAGNLRSVRGSKLKTRSFVWLNADGSVRKTAKSVTSFTEMERLLDQPKLREPKRVPEGYYVYMVSIRGQVVYVGMGRGHRWRHCSSGMSANRELNRAYFKKEPVMTEVFSKGLDRKTAQKLERQLILKYSPAFNKIVPSLNE